ncbi:hypothetical protein K1T71_009134 [Dendrolimus kikuchii]|uniref:Uncharacterized protein n=1 Tax=Dendrolimus kikuchii TaxID=765133 RepID=A0ACC1CTN8_9NEOP|nr:hypothetical protein K1T71_009134 [Dendrolimus kikuchii]
MGHIAESARVSGGRSAAARYRPRRMPPARQRRGALSHRHRPPPTARSRAPTAAHVRGAEVSEATRASLPLQAATEAGRPGKASPRRGAGPRAPRAAPARPPPRRPPPAMCPQPEA